uniref:Putative basic tail protein n=1 Tax=Ixodes ricinus TaxID=34613 RepID=A0A0K8R943_IXORI
MKLGMASSVFIIVTLASANCDEENPFPDVIAQWPKAGNVTIKYGCPMTRRTEELAARYPYCVYYCKKNSTWFYGFYHHATRCDYGADKLPGVCILGLCYLETETVTDATSPDSTQTPRVENVTTPLPPVETKTAPTTATWKVERQSQTKALDNESNHTSPVENGTTPTVPVGN